MMRGRAFLFALALSVLLSVTLAPALVAAEGNVKDVRLNVRGPDVMGTYHTSGFDITILDPEERGWKYEVWVTARNTTGAAPLEPNKATGNLSAENATFSVDITAMANSGEMTLMINVSSPTGTLWYVREYEITVVDPIVIKADIFNSGTVEIRNATVQFYVDDEIIKTDTLKSLEPGASTTLSGEWVSDEIEDGWHTSRVVVDVNNDGVIDPSIGDIEINNKFYVEGRNISASLFILIGLLALLVGMVLINRQMKGKRR